VAESSEPAITAYQLRRQSRGGAPPTVRSPWRRRILWIGGVLVGLAAIVLAIHVVWIWPYVKTVRASVHTSVVELASHVDARLLELHVRPGELVKKGQPLARLDDSELRALLLVAEADRDVKKAQRERAEANARWVRVHAVANLAMAKAQLAVAEAELRWSQAEVAVRRTTLANMTIVSPVAGRVIETLRREGEICRKGLPMVLVAEEGAGYWVEGVVHEQDAAAVRPGQPAEVEVVVGSGDTVAGEIVAVGLATASVAAASAEQPRTTARPWAPKYVWVKIRLLEQREPWRPGMSAYASIRVR